MQIFPNFVKPDATTNGRAPIQAAKVTQLISVAGIVTVTWDTPFPDDNYIVSLALEGSFAGENDGTISGFNKTASGLLVYVNMTSGGTATVTVHAVAFHA
jgi:hypothetical protein